MTPELSSETYATIDQIVRVCSAAVAEAQEESRRLGVPNVYCINQRIYYETPSGELSMTDPYPSSQANDAAGKVGH